MTYTISLKNKVAVVTGGGTGLGKQTAMNLAQAGANIVLASIDLPSIEEVAGLIRMQGGSVIAVKTDVSREDQVHEMVKEAERSFGGIDILVNSAAIYPSKPFEEVSVEEWDQVFAVNSRGYFICAKAVTPHMKKQGWGRIINMSSITFFQGFPNLIHYVSTKGSVIGMTRALAREVGSYGITVNSISPGAFPTAAEEIHPDREGYNQRILESQCIKRRGTPDDIANTVLFFASDLSEFITGQTILVDGGWSMN